MAPGYKIHHNRLTIGRIRCINAFRIHSIYLGMMWVVGHLLYFIWDWFKKKIFVFWWIRLKNVTKVWYSKHYEAREINIHRFYTYKYNRIAYKRKLMDFLTLSIQRKLHKCTVRCNPPVTKHVLPQGYDTVSHDPHHYEGKKVLILGKGESSRNPYPIAILIKFSIFLRCLGFQLVFQLTMHLIHLTILNTPKIVVIWKF